MTRFRIGIGLLLLLLALGIEAQIAMDTLHAPAAAQLDAASQAALQGDTEASRAMADEAAARWQKYWRFTAILADHGPMEDVDSLLAQLPAMAEDPAQFAAACAELSRRITAIADAHRWSWWNLL